MKSARAMNNKAIKDFKKERKKINKEAEMKRKQIVDSEDGKSEKPMGR